MEDEVQVLQCGIKVKHAMHSPLFYASRKPGEQLEHEAYPSHAEQLLIEALQGRQRLRDR
jgi:hypothetical protein